MSLAMFLCHILLASQVQAQQSSLTLADVFREADLNDPQWAAMQFSIRSQQQISNQTKAGLMPSVTFTATTYNKDQDYADTNSGSGVNENSYETTISQPLFHLDNWYQHKYGKTVRRQLNHVLVSERQKFIVRVVEAYLGVLRANEGLAFANAESSAVARQLEQTKQRFDVGLIAITDVHESQAAFDLTTVNLLIAQSMVAVAYESLEALTGSTINKVRSLHEEFPVSPPIPNELSDWLSKAQENNPDLRAAELAKTAAHFNKQKALSAYAPDISFAATVAHQSDTSFGTTLIPESDTTTYALQLTWTPYLGGSIIATKKEATLKQEQARAELSSAQRGVIQQVQNTFRMVNTDVLRVQARQQAIKSSNSALKAIQSGYEVGTRNIVDVLQAQRGLFAAKRDYANARYDYIIDLFKLEQLAGSLNTKDIEELNWWFTN